MRVDYSPITLSEVPRPVAPPTGLQTRCGSSLQPNTADAVRELAEQLHSGDAELVLVFASPKYELEQLGSLLSDQFGDTLVGCTTSGQLGPKGYQSAGLCGVSLRSDQLSVRTFPLEPLSNPVPAVDAVVRAVHESGVITGKPGEHCVGLVHLDGLSLAEERVMSLLQRALPEVACVGGSAGDDLQFESTGVLHNGRFRSNTGTLTIISTPLDIRPVRFHHHQPTGKRLVITHAEPAKRRVLAMNGKPAAQAYAEALGIPLDELTAETFSDHPLMLKIGGEFYVRSIRCVNDDLSLDFYCAIDNGLVLRFGSGERIVEGLAESLSTVAASVQDCELVIGYDCILRRLEIDRRGLREDINAVLRSHRVIGFNTYGEQFNGIHMNQTFTGLALGRSEPT